jgi:2-methylcitrate dehydratase PrpD
MVGRRGLEGTMELDQFVTTLRWEELRPETQEITRRCLLDLLGCALAGVQADNFRSLVDGIKKLDREETSHVWGSEVKTGLPWSIFLNAYTASFFDLDDGHRLAQGHPGAAVIPAALATAASIGAPGKALLEAIVIGYEVAVRSALVMRNLGGPRKGSGAWVVPGVAAAVARLMDLAPGRVLDAVGLAEYFSLQATQDRSASYPSPMKEGLSWGAYTGYIAAFLASQGFRGMRPHLADSPLLDNLSVSWEIEKVYFKRYACCRWAHPALDGLEEMLRKEPLSWMEIDRIRIRTFEKATLLDRRDPADTLEAVYSIPFVIGSYLVHGRVTPAQVSGENLWDHRVADLSRLVFLESDEELTAKFPAQCLQQISVTFRDGRSYESGTLSAKGDPADPLSRDDLLAKFRMLSEPRLGGQWRRIPETIDMLEWGRAADLVDLLR